jgi:hypothetical protein
LIGWPVRSLCQIAAVRARTRCTRGPTPRGGVASVLFQVELALEGVVDRFDDLPQWCEELGSGPRGLALAGWSQQVQSGVGEFGLEPAAVVVRDQDLAGPAGGQLGVGVEDPEQGLAFVGLRPGQREPDRQPVQRAPQVQPQPPEEPGVAGAVAVLGPPGQVRALHRLAGAGALDRGGVGHPHVVGPQPGVAGQDPDQPADRGALPAQPLVVAGLLGQVRNRCCRWARA